MAGIVRLQTLVQNEAIEYNNIKDFFAEYQVRVKDAPIKDLKLYKKIVSLFFKKFKESIFNGNKLSTTIGSFCIIKCELSQPKLLLRDKKRLEKEFGDPNKVLYRENTYFYKVGWFKRKEATAIKGITFFSDYYFKIAQGAGREIPLYQKILDIRVK